MITARERPAGRLTAILMQNGVRPVPISAIRSTSARARSARPGSSARASCRAGCGPAGGRPWCCALQPWRAPRRHDPGPVRLPELLSSGRSACAWSSQLDRRLRPAARRPHAAARRSGAAWPRAGPPSAARSASRPRASGTPLAAHPRGARRARPTTATTPSACSPPARTTPTRTAGATVAVPYVIYAGAPPPG